ncbi:hypothetical protein ACFUMH_06790 [Cellulomonas sp. NPDC057328]|uniref:hypothetical protein n=1 Tax=Cellulomonas sp. NPDC057328 TaxID=3346101 RepID=UPI003633D8DF
MTTSSTAPPALARLRPPSRTVPALLHRHDVGPLAWAGLLADGHLVPLWGAVARTAGTAETPAVRAAALAGLVPARGAVGRLSAVWVHAGGVAPRRATVLVGAGTRRPDAHPDRWVAEARLPAADVVVLGGTAVTTPLRTVLDVARWEPPAAARAAVHRLADRCGVDLAAAAAVLDDLEGHRGVRRARALLRGAAGAGGTRAVRPG